MLMAPEQLFSQCVVITITLNLVDFSLFVIHILGSDRYPRAIRPIWTYRTKGSINTY